ncbi:hypothetical protein [Cellulomonas sp. URHE0023]|uniref:hypothetical protein n=1 Tax=Cellulomonas sp. URHE0023 TaxID=1380354 RepID=UPI00048366EF|nr:hypothetical protein [Cellulomonas sp. URHE0023]
MTDTHPLPFGAAPVPSSDTELESRIRALLASLAQPGVRGLDGAHVVAVLDGADIASLRVDATGVTVDDDRLSRVRITAPSVDVTRRDPGTIRTLEVTAHPASVMGVRADVDIAARDLHFDWAFGSDDQLYVEVRPPSDSTPAVGTARIAAAHKDIVAAARTALAGILRSKGFTLTALDLTVRNDGPRALTVRADAKVAKAFLRAGVTVTASASIDRSLVLDVADVKMSGSNPVVEGLIAPFRSKISAASDRRIDLAAQLPAGVTVSDVSVVAGEEVVVTVTLG